MCGSRPWRTKVLNQKFGVLGVAASVLFAGTNSFAQAPDYTIHQEYTSTRALGMGNAFTAVVDDHSAIFYNPAALALRKEGQLRMMIRGGLSDNYPGVINDVKDASSSKDTAKIVQVLESHYGEHLYSRVTVGGLYARPNWGLAVLPADFSADISVNRLLGPSLGVNGYLDSTLAYSYARAIGPKTEDGSRLAIGGTLKALHRAYYTDIINAGMLATGEDVFDLKKSREGMTADVDLGLLWTPNFKSHTLFGKILKPSFAVVIRNLGDYGFPWQFDVFSDGSKKPPKLQRRLDLGSKYSLPRFWVFDSKFAFDVKDIGHDNWTIKKSWHAGFEAYWKMRTWWKGHWSAGFNQGYWTAGFGARLAIFQLDLATWGEEVGTSRTPTESRRYIAEMSLDF